MELTVVGIRRPRLASICIPYVSTGKYINTVYVNTVQVDQVIWYVAIAE